MHPVNLLTLQNGERFDGLFFVSSCGKKLDMASKAPLVGQVSYKGRTLSFKIWDSPLQKMINANNLEGLIIQAQGTAETYKDNLELVFSLISFPQEAVDRTQFYRSVDLEQVFGSFVSFVNGSLSPQAVALLQTTFKKANLFDPFKLTWAAKKMHDAQVGGLMNHTTKMLHLAQTLVSNDSRIQPYSDLLYLGIIFHDIGKVMEYAEGGLFTKNAFVGHRTFGVEILISVKSEIITSFGEGFFYRLIDIITGHHGEYADKPATVWGLFVHLIDMLDSQVTGILDRLETNSCGEQSGNKTVWANGDNLVV